MKKLDLRLMKPEEAAAFLSISMAELGRLRRLGRGPAYYKLSSRLYRYRRADLAAWKTGRAPRRGRKQLRAAARTKAAGRA